MRDAADGGQCFAAKAQRVDAQEIIDGVQLAGGMAGEGQRQIVAIYAAAIIRDLNKVTATVGDVHVDARAAGIDGILQEFLDYAGRSLDDLSGGNLIDEGRW